MCCGLGDATDPRPVVIYGRLRRPGKVAEAGCRAEIDACRAWAREHGRRIIDAYLDVLPAADVDGEPLSWAPSLLVARVELASARAAAAVGGADILVASVGTITAYPEHILGWLSNGQIGLISLDGLVVHRGDIATWRPASVTQVTAAWRPAVVAGQAHPVRPGGHG